MNTTKAATASRMLFSTSMDSRLRREKTPREDSASARAAKRVSAPPMNRAVMASRKTPRSGSVAKACTEVMMPDRVMKAPISEKPKAVMASSTVQAFRLSRFSTTMAECSSAAAISQGMNDAFSTGSQNQNPPQPNS